MSRSCAVVGDLQGVAWFYSSGFEVNSFARALLPFRRCLATLLPALPSPFSGKYVVSIMVPLSFVSVTVPGGCRSQGCHGYPTRSAPVLEAPPSFQAPSPSSSIVDEFNYYKFKVLPRKQAPRGTLVAGRKRKECSQLRLWNLNSTSNSLVAPRQLSCKISTN